jgi:carbon monoxide dehydrogenase subunit G
VTLIESMELDAPSHEVWGLLVERGAVLRLLPGLTPSGSGRGTLRITLDGHSVTYRGYARQHLDDPDHRVTWTLSGREVRGTGRAHVEVRARFKPVGDDRCDLRLTVLVDGRGRLNEVSQEARDRAVRAAISRFRRSLEQELSEFGPAALPVEEPQTAADAPATDPTVPELEIVPPVPEQRHLARNSMVYALGGLILGTIAASLWRWLGSRRR